MAQPTLTDLQRKVYEALILAPDARVADRTVEAMAKRADLSEPVVRDTLKQLESVKPKIVHRYTDAKLDAEFWIALDSDLLDETRAGADVRKLRP